jgi:hypothetical protein
MSLQVNTQVYIPHSDKWGIITNCYGSEYQVKFTKISDTCIYDMMYTEAHTYETFNKTRLVPFHPPNSWVRCSGLRARVLSSRYDADTQQFIYRIHVSADEFPMHHSDYLPSDKEFTVRGEYLEYT